MNIIPVSSILLLKNTGCGCLKIQHFLQRCIMAPAGGDCNGVGTAEVPVEKHPCTRQPFPAAGSFGNGLFTQDQCLIYHSDFAHCLQLVV